MAESNASRLMYHCIKCESFCDETEFCEICERNARYCMTEHFKKFNTRLERISQFLFEMLLEIYRCSWFVNTYHQKLKNKQKTGSLQTDFSKYRNSQYSAMRTFASQMSLNNGTMGDQTSETSDEENVSVDCEPLTRGLPKNSSFQSMPTYSSTTNETYFCSLGNNYRSGEYSKVTQNGLYEDSMETTLSLSKDHIISQSAAPNQQMNFGGMMTSHDYHVISVPTQHLSESTELLTKTHDDFGRNGMIEAKDIDELFNFDTPTKPGPLGASISSVEDERSSEHHRNSMVLPDTQPKVHPIVPPRTPQLERRKRQGGFSYGDPYRRSLVNTTSSSRDISSRRKSGDSGLFQSIVNIWKRGESDKMCANMTDGLLESDFLLENLIRLYFKCRNKLNNQSLRGTECMDIRQELYQKIKSFRVALEASNQDMDELSSSFNICVILTTRLFQKTFSKNEIQLIKAIAQYFTKKWFGSAFRLRNFAERKDDLLKKVMKFLDREL